MTAGTLKALLETLPDDTPVEVAFGEQASPFRTRTDGHEILAAQVEAGFLAGARLVLIADVAVPA